MSCANSSAGAITQIFGALPLPPLAHAVTEKGTVTVVLISM